MPLVWLVYEQDGKKAVVIERGMSIVSARLRASMAHDIDRYFVEAHGLPEGANVEPEKVGKLLSARQAQRVLASLST